VSRWEGHCLLNLWVYLWTLCCMQPGLWTKGLEEKKEVFS